MGTYYGPRRSQKNPFARNAYDPFRHYMKIEVAKARKGKTSSFPLLKPAPIVTQNRTGASFKGFGVSHFTYRRGQGYHVTTQVPSFGRRERLKGGLSIRTPKRGGF